MNSLNLRVALVHDWLTRMGGAEKCLEAFCEMFPRSDIFTLFHDAGAVSEKIESHKIFTSSLHKFPLRKKYYRYLLPKMPGAIEEFDFHAYDLVISGSWCVAKGVITPHTVPHISYTYTPMRFAWDGYGEYFGARSGIPVWKRKIIAPQISKLRQWDVVSAGRVDEFIAISKEVAGRIQKTYRRDSVVLYPPVDRARFLLSEEEREPFFLMVTTFEPNKHAEEAIEAFNLLGMRLKVVGDGRQRASLERQAGENIEFLGRVSDDDLVDLYSRANALIHPAFDDFGIIPVEAMTCGTPVIGFAGGGLLETLVPVNPVDGMKVGKIPSGFFYYQRTAHALMDAVKQFQKYDREKGWNRKKIRQSTEKYNQKRFSREVLTRLSTVYKKYQKHLPR